MLNTTSRFCPDSSDIHFSALSDFHPFYIKYLQCPLVYRLTLRRNAWSTDSIPPINDEGGGVKTEFECQRMIYSKSLESR